MYMTGMCTFHIFACAVCMNPICKPTGCSTVYTCIQRYNELYRCADLLFGRSSHILNCSGTACADSSQISPLLH